MPPTGTCRCTPCTGLLPKASLPCLPARRMWVWRMSASLARFFWVVSDVPGRSSGPYRGTLQSSNQRPTASQKAGRVHIMRCRPAACLSMCASLRRTWRGSVAPRTRIQFSPAASHPLRAPFRVHVGPQGLLQGLHHWVELPVHWPPERLPHGHLLRLHRRHST